MRLREGRAPRRVACLAALACLLPAVDGAAALSALGSAAPVPDLALAQDRRLGQPLIIAWRIPAPAGLRQALAHALDCWLVPDQDGSWRLTMTPALVQGPLRVRVHPSRLIDRPEAEDLVLSRMRPWLHGHAGIVLEPRSGAWTATLDAAGHARLVALLAALDGDRPAAPALITPESVDPSIPELVAAPWQSWSDTLAAHLGETVSVVPQATASGPRLAPGSLDRALSAHGLRARRIHGIWCIGTASPTDRHLGLTRIRDALIPVAHLGSAVDGIAPGPADGPLIARLPWAPALLVTGTPEQIHAVLARLEALDR